MLYFIFEYCRCARKEWDLIKQRSSPDSYCSVMCPCTYWGNRNCWLCSPRPFLGCACCSPALIRVWHIQLECWRDFYAGTLFQGVGSAKGLHQGWTGSQCLISGSSRGKWCLQTPGDQETWSWGVLVTEGLSSTGMSKVEGSRTAENPQLSCLRPSDHTQIPLLA